MNMRLIRAFLIAPLAPCLIAATILVISNRDILAFPVAILLYAAFAYPFAFLLGVPGYFIMAKTGLLSMWPSIAAGSVLGAVSGILLPLFIGVETERAFSAEWWPLVVIFTAFGTITAWAFWWLALRPRPNILAARPSP